MKGKDLNISFITRAYPTAERALQINAQVEFLVGMVPPASKNPTDGALAVGGKVVQLGDTVHVIAMGAEVGEKLHKRLLTILDTPDALDIIPDALWDVVSKMTEALIAQLRAHGHTIGESPALPELPPTPFVN